MSVALVQSHKDVAVFSLALKFPPSTKLDNYDSVMFEVALGHNYQLSIL